MNKWIDVHCHINMLEKSPEESVNEALAAGVERMITIGTCHRDHPVVIDLADKFAPHVYCTLGVHPHDGSTYDTQSEEYILENLSHPRVVAVGEIGLDYYYDNSPRDEQQIAFRRQLEIAVEHNLPVEIHTREAEEDTVKILKSFDGRVKGLLHCFTGTQYLADEAMKLGLNISISGVVTFKKAGELRKVVESIPLDRLHVETDSPFLTPVPFRGKKNAPAYVPHVATVVADLKRVTEEQLAAQTRDNALALFSRLSW